MTGARLASLCHAQRECDSNDAGSCDCVNPTRRAICRFSVFFYYDLPHTLERRDGEVPATWAFLAKLYAVQNERSPNGSEVAGTLHTFDSEPSRW